VNIAQIENDLFNISVIWEYKRVSSKKMKAKDMWLDILAKNLHSCDYDSVVVSSLLSGKASLPIDEVTLYGKPVIYVEDVRSTSPLDLVLILALFFYFFIVYMTPPHYGVDFLEIAA
jgi:hypothetical protein